MSHPSPQIHTLLLAVCMACGPANALVLNSTTFAAEFPRKAISDPCHQPPTIDGVIGDDEWKDARAIEFEMPFVQLKPAASSKRVCQWRAMNSANGLYIALRIPDEAVNKSLAPLNFDFALLAFCRGKDLASGDDRKTVGPGLYVDKHMTTPGKDADDKQQDGKGAMAHDKGVYSIEWAIPLDSGDSEDVRARPGDVLRFNLAYFDAFQASLEGTQIGTAYPGGLDQATDWGTLQLAADVKDDGGAAFKGPAWVESLFQSFRGLPAGRLRLIESAVIPAEPQPIAKALVEFTYRDPHGKEAFGKAKLFLPADVEHGRTKFGLFLGAGYELDDASAAAHVGRGFVVVTPRALEANPLVRTINPDAALLHMARSFPFVDDARVVIAGGSAGGYATLMLAAETFPLAGAAADVPPVNWGYNAAYFLQPLTAAQAGDSKAAKVPVFDVIVPIAKQATSVYGDNPSDETYFRNSPVAHLETITCPVSAFWSTADMLVPIDQIGSKWIRPFDAATFPGGFTLDRAKLTNSDAGRAQLLDRLNEDDYELFVLPEEAVKERAAAASKETPELAASTSKRWSITILDEGAPVPALGHLKYQLVWSHRKFLADVVTRKISADQLTRRKLERLMDRYGGREWLPTPVRHLDEPESERADVMRGLKTYVASSPENARVFSELYAKLPSDKQVLPADVVEKLGK
jgi:hypothetical protein